MSKIDLGKYKLRTDLIIEDNELITKDILDNEKSPNGGNRQDFR